MRRPIDNLRAWMIVLAAATVIAALASGCTVIRYVDGGGGGGGGGEPPPPKVVDVLVQVNLRRSTGNLAPDYQRILGLFEAGLSEKNVTVRKMALAPMYRRHGNVVPLLWGRGEGSSQFGQIGTAIGFYSRDDGAKYLTDKSSVDGENLAALGLQLDQRAIYQPKMADPESRAYFNQPADGFVVVSLSAAPRRCNAKSSDCKLDGRSPWKYFTQKGKDGAKWLILPGGSSLPPSKIFHASIVTGEGLGWSEFASGCRSEPKFPKTRLDVMEPSDKKYFTPMSNKLRKNGSPAKRVGLCSAMSARAESVMLGLAGDIKSMF